MKTAIILGATGITGGHLLKLLLNDPQYHKIKLFSRSSAHINHPKIEEYLVDLTDPESYAKDFFADEVFCCIGTTKSKTPDKNKYHQIDYGIPVHAARLCKTNNIKSFLVISALGADPTSRIFYSRTKGEMEQAVLEYNIPDTYILQPSLIASEREENRTGEAIMIHIMDVINPLLIGNLKKYRSIEAKDIAKVMLWLANNPYEDSRVPSDKIQKLANQNNL